MDSTTSDTPSLYLIPSTMSDAPVANVIPQLNIDITRRLRHFIVENERTARRFLKRCDRAIDIDALTFSTLNTHTLPAELPAMLEPLRQGHDMGVISEAGCPAVADPGADIVAIAQREGFRVVPLVGPSSIIMSLMASGFNGQSFAFAGYLPIDASARTAALREMERMIQRRDQTQIFIETPYRNDRLLAELVKTLPGHLRLCVAADITGPSQTIITRPLSQWARNPMRISKRPCIFLLYK